jgi:hypothetical protein
MWFDRVTRLVVACLPLAMFHAEAIELEDCETKATLRTR